MLLTARASSDGLLRSRFCKTIVRRGHSHRVRRDQPHTRIALLSALCPTRALTHITAL